jgi:hypothetical protein
MKMISALSILVGFWSAACSASKISTDRITDPTYSSCDGVKARKKLDFVLSSYVKVPSGMRADKVPDYMEQLRREYDFVAENWMKYLMAHWYGKATEGFVSGTTPALRNFRDEGVPVGQFSHAYYHRAIIRTGDNAFVLCDGDACAGLVDPENGKKIEKSDVTSVHVGEKICRPYFADEVDPPVEDFSKFPIGIEKGCKQNLFSRERFAAATGFKGGTILNVYYFAVPERDNPAICRASGLQENCFKSFDVAALERYQKNENFEMEQPFAKEFIESNCGACLSNGGSDARAAFAGNLKSDGHLRLEWESALAKDLFLKAGSKITRKVQGNWITYRIEWDPTLLCKYGHDRSELYTH